MAAKPDRGGGIASPGKAKNMAIIRKLPLILLFILLLFPVLILACRQAPEKTPQASTPQVTRLSHSWGTADPAITRIISKATIRNPYPFPVSLRRIEYEVRLGEITFGQGSTEKNLELAPNSETEVSFEVTLDNTKLSQWWIAHIKNKELTPFIYKGTMVFDLRAMEYKHPFELKREIRTNLLGTQR